MSAERGLWARAKLFNVFRKPPRKFSRGAARAVRAAYRPDLVSGLLSRESTLCVLQGEGCWVGRGTHWGPPWMGSGGRYLEQGEPSP